MTYFAQIIHELKSSSEFQFIKIWNCKMFLLRKWFYNKAIILAAGMDWMQFNKNKSCLSNICQLSMLFSFKKVKKNFQLKQASYNHSFYHKAGFMFYFQQYFFTLNYFVKYLLKKKIGHCYIILAALYWKIVQICH